MGALTKADMDALLARADRIITEARHTSAEVGAKLGYATAADDKVITQSVSPPKPTKSR